MENDVLKQLNGLSYERIEEIIRDLEAQGDQNLLAMRAILKVGFKDRWLSTVEAIRGIGYPQNKEALPELLLDQVGDRNSEAWHEAVQTILEMDAHFVDPYIIQVLLDEGRTIPYWAPIAEGLCIMVSNFPLSRILYLTPVLVYLLAKEALPGDFDKTTLLDALEKVPFEKIVYALPALIYVANADSDKNPCMNQQAKDILKHLDNDTLIPYLRLISNDTII